MNQNVPLIGTGKTAAGLPTFAKKAEPDAGGVTVRVPNIYYWEDVDLGGQKSMMTIAFKWKGMNYGMSYPIESQNVVRINMDKRRLFQVVKESLDVLVHHGDKVVDGGGNINPRKVNDEEATRFKFDPIWDKKVAAFNKVVRLKEIPRAEAVKLGLV